VIFLGWRPLSVSIALALPRQSPHSSDAGLHVAQPWRGGAAQDAGRTTTSKGPYKSSLLETCSDPQNAADDRKNEPNRKDPIGFPAAFTGGSSRAVNCIAEFSGFGLHFHRDASHATAANVGHLGAAPRGRWTWPIVSLKPLQPWACAIGPLNPARPTPLDGSLDLE
jgi:hypothetical protein